MVNFKPLAINAATGSGLDPLLANRFSVSWGGKTRGGFSKISGLGEETEVFEVNEITDPVTTRKLFDITKFRNVTFEHGVIFDLSLVAWRRQIVESSFLLDTNVLKRTITIQVYSRVPYRTQKGLTIADLKFELLDAWPISLNYNELDASRSEIFLESVEFAHEGLITSSPVSDEITDGMTR